MGLLEVLRAGIKVADGITNPLQGTVGYERASLGADGYSTVGYTTSVPLRAIIDYRSVQARDRDGVLTMTVATLELLDVTAVEAATGGSGISNNDQFTLPNGRVCQVLSPLGFIDAGTGQPVATTVLLG